VDRVLALPLRQRLAGVDAEEVQFAVALALGELGVRKPALGNSPRVFVIYFLFSAEHAEAQHLGVKSGVNMKPGVAPRPHRALLAITFLHPVVNDDGACAHQFASVSAGVAAKLG
jgi:hypothetical protein